MAEKISMSVSSQRRMSDAFNEYCIQLLMINSKYAEVVNIFFFKTNTLTAAKRAYPRPDHKNLVPSIQRMVLSLRATQWHHHT